jgi:DNA ligase D-like protein (predicted 3'-phosphoesterase)
MNAEDELAEYREKRDFRRTREPSGKRRGSSTQPVFVIQQHAASRMHYDFRLEVDGVLKSWAVPKGPSTDPREKRLAVPTEDHPLAYADFEGVIPEDEYGGGTVLVWDRGSYRNLRRDKDREERTMADCHREGKIEVWLEGSKISGGYALIRTGEERWLLVKMDDERADARRNPTGTQPDSVISGRSLEQIAAEEDGS